MIAYLSGKIVSIEKDKIIISAGGVGYEANCTQKTSDKFFDKNECELFIKTVVKEDDISLYGFQTVEDKRWFEIVTDVQGVGPRMGLSILNTYDHNSLLEIIMSEDDKALKAISGIGPKVASRMINELRSRKDLTSQDVSFSTTAPESNATPTSNSDAVSALVNLGFQRKDVFFAVKKVTADNEDIVLEDVIKLALVELNS